MNASPYKLLIYSASETQLKDLCKLTSQLDYKCQNLRELKLLPKVESLDYYDLLLFCLDKSNTAAEIATIKKIKEQFPGLVLPIILFGDGDGLKSIGKLNGQYIQDYISLPITKEFLDFRLRLHLEVKQSFLDIKEREAQLSEEVISKTQAYKTAQLKAEESERLKTAFLNNLSHEMRTPMNGILGFIDYLEDPDLEGETRARFVQNIKTSSERLLNTLRDLIEISEIEAGSIKAEIGPCDLKEINGNLFERYRSRCAEKGLRLIQEFQLGPAESVVLSDINKIKSVLYHFLNNAIKFSEKGSIRYGFRREGKDLVAYVSDEGPGIAKKDQEKLVESFTQIEDHLTRKHDGLGIGLSISKAFIESLKGRLEIESNLGKGSTFSFRMPYQAYQEQKIDSSIKAGKLLAEKENLEVIIVDDDPINIALMRKILEQRAAKIHEAYNGVEALKAYKDYPQSDLILMDLKMPVMDGYEAVAELRSAGAKIPIIAQTAYAMAPDKQRALEAGCNDYISKPLNKSLLLDKINQLAQ